MLGAKLLTVDDLNRFVVANGIPFNCPIMVAIRPSAYSDVELWRIGVEPSLTSRFVAIKDEQPLKDVVYLNTLADLLGVVTKKRDEGDWSETHLTFTLRSGRSFKTSSSGYAIDGVVPTPNGLHLSLVLF
jgi:hypothetical protein